MWRPIAIAFVASLAVCGVIQQSFLAIAGLPDPLSALPPLAGIVLPISMVFAVVCRRGVRLAAIDRTAIWLLAVMLAIGLGAILVGLAELTPGIGGNILFEIARVTGLYFLLPAAAAVPIHWLLLRRAAGL